MNFECSLDRLIELRKIEVLYTRQFIWHITFPIIGGFMFGYNTGVISGALILIKEPFIKNTIMKEIIVGATVFTAFLSSLLTGYLTNKFGRKKVMVLSCVFFIIGSSIMIWNNLYILILGRAVVGIGVGMSSTCCPIYIAEMTPKLIRGRIIALYQVSITFGMLLAAIISASFSYSQIESWQYTLSIAAIPALFEFFGLFTISESYRWLLLKNRIAEAKEVIIKLNQIQIIDVNDFIDNIVHANEITDHHLQERSINQKFSINQIFIDNVARKSLIFGCSLQILSQIVGINTIMYYTATVIRMSEVNDTLWLSSLVAFFNFLPSFVGMVLIDKIGRRKLLIISLLGIFFSTVILALTFQVITVQSSKVNTTISLYPKDNLECSQNTNCEYCIASNKCGFCFDKQNYFNTCLSVSTINNNFSADGSCIEGHSNNYTFQYGYCESTYTWIIIIGMIFYIVSYTIGMGPIPWIVTSEIYPIWCRSFNMSLSTASNWLFNLIITLTFLTLTEKIYKYGTFWLYSLFTFCGIVLVYKYLPETQKVELEEIPPILSE